MLANHFKPSTRSAIPSAWDASAHGLWLRGEPVQAITTALNSTRGSASAERLGRFSQAAYYMFLIGDFGSAGQIYGLALQDAELDPASMQAHHLRLNLAACHGRMGRDADAVALAREAASNRPDDFKAYDILAHSLGLLGQTGPASQAGTRALQLKDALTHQHTARLNWPPAQDARADAAPGKQDVIAFSLWGSAPRYLRGMLRNLLLAHDMMPGWIVRIYTDASLDAEFVGLVQSLGAQVVMQPSGAPTRVRLCWRFQVANDPAVRRFLVRDADATISVREAMAVQAWVQSGRCFHVIRDWWSHTDLMLAGLWGGMANVLPPLAPLQQAYTPHAMETANLDQWFLRDVVWPYVRQSCLVHDRCFRFGDVERPPQAPAVAGSHMGQNESANAHVDQQRWLAPWIERYPCLQERRA